MGGGGAKKKTLANKLAKMSDEDRARYLQHKADMEEEAKRRKEQLIATFMKNKIKKEEAFSRLNLAKINQQWHQVLRLNKCKEMKQNVEHMKKYLDRILEYKNRIIAKLLQLLETAEEQYSVNYNTHMTQINQIIGSNQQYVKKLGDIYQDDLSNLIKIQKVERNEILESSSTQQQFLKTVTFGQNTKHRQALQRDRQHWTKTKEEITSTFELRLQTLRKGHEATKVAIWRQIATVVEDHIRKIDGRRMHLAELSRIDVESAAEVQANQGRIKVQEREIVHLESEYENLTEQNEELISKLKYQVTKISQELTSKRNVFRRLSDKSNSQLLTLASTSNKSIHTLEKLESKGQHLLVLITNCNKYESEDEKLSKWLPNVLEQSTIPDDIDIPEEALQQQDEENVKKIIISSKDRQVLSISGEKSLKDFLQKYDHLNGLNKFWLTFNRVNLNLRELRLEKNSLKRENQIITERIKEFLEAKALRTCKGKSRSDKTSQQSKKDLVRRDLKSAPVTKILIQ